MFPQPFRVTKVISPILQLRKLRLREVKQQQVRGSTQTRGLAVHHQSHILITTPQFIIMNSTSKVAGKIFFFSGN